VSEQTSHSAFDWVPPAAVGFAGSVLLAAAYALSGCLLLAALHKPFVPDQVGLWHFADEFSLHLGFGSSVVSPHAVELLGWWVIPLGFLFGGVGVFATNRLAISIFTWELVFWRQRISKETAFAALELVIVAGLLIADHFHLVPFSNTPFLLALGWLSLHRRGLKWRDVGLTMPQDWIRTLTTGLAAGIALECVSLLITEPLIAHTTGISPDRSDFRVIIGHPGVLSLALALNWTLAAFGEEMAWRGYLLSRLRQDGGNRVVSQMVALGLVSALFGIAHSESQGVGGALQEGFAGLVLGVLYLASGRRLALPILAHGASNTLALVLIYLNRYPGL
jgi:membrane protease YdiL (CAAX protease family)